VGFDPTIPAFKREKTVHALDGAATVIGDFLIYFMKTHSDDVRKFSEGYLRLVVNC
jgi:hypothetical protein